MIEVRDKALMWPLEDPKLHASKVALNGSKASKALNHNVISEATEAQCVVMVMPAVSTAGTRRGHRGLDSSFSETDFFTALSLNL